jgi:hypothetical protein
MGRRRGEGGQQCQRFPDAHEAGGAAQGRHVAVACGWHVGLEDEIQFTGLGDLYACSAPGSG